MYSMNCIFENLSIIMHIVTFLSVCSLYVGVFKIFKFLKVTSRDVNYNNLKILTNLTLIKKNRICTKFVLQIIIQLFFIII